MASSYSSAPPLTLHVRNLQQATSFYLAALSPLGYGFISEVEHRTPTASSKAVGIGPAGTSTVDVFLSQSLQPDPPQARGAHVVFPAASTIAVREFYAAALQAGAKPVARPDNLSSSDGMFATIIGDIDGNQVEVCYAGDLPSGSVVDGGITDGPAESLPESSGSIEKWRDGIAGDSVVGSKAPSETPKAARSANPRSSLKSAISAAKSLAASGPVKTVMSAAASSQASSRRSTSTSRTNRTARRKSISGTPSINAGNKTVVGTLIGAAAGAALAYTVVRSKRDNAEQQHEHDRRMRSIDAKAEARTHCAAVDRHQTTGKTELADRDSGYGSGSQYSASPPIYRSATYPQPVNAPHAERERSTATKYIDYGRRSLSPDAYYQQQPPRKQSSVGGSSSQSTIKPVRRSESNASRRSSSRHLTEPLRGPPAPPQGPPSMPPPPPTKSRRGSMSSQGGGDLSRQYPAKDKPPSSFQRAMGIEAPQTHNAKPGRATSTHYSARSARDVPLPPSETHSTSTMRRAHSLKSHASANYPTAAHEANDYGARPPSSHRPSGGSHRAPSTTSSALTAKALRAQDETQQPGRGNKWDELATIVPDDSISCASEREERRELEARAGRRERRSDSRSSRRLSYRDR
ncbi:MAG: hypothetical protein Q9159_006766 [Coniocarpon cinnabarinum]